MREKISEEMARNLLQDVNGPEETKQRIIERWRAAGLLEPEKDEEARAKREWEEAALLELDKYKTRSAALKYINILEARLKASAWTDELVKEYGGYCYGNGEEGNPFYIPESWLARRQAKGKE